MLETEHDATLLVHGSYHASYRFYDKLIVTDRDTYFFDILAGTLRTASGTVAIEPEQENAARVVFDISRCRACGPSTARVRSLGAAGDAGAAGSAGQVG